MKICPITYEKISDGSNYSKKGLHQLSPVLKTLNDFPYTEEEQRKEAEFRSSKMSIQGVQPKISAILAIKESQFKIVDRGGRYILKPQIERFRYLPENEDLTMKLAALVKIEVPLHGLIYSKDGSKTYFIHRYDRKGQKSKIHVEDFAQLSGADRNTKYDSSMEKVAKVIEKYCTFPMLEKLKLFERTLFSFIVGNEDMHLKNFSIIVRNDKIELSPAYDLVNSTIVLRNPKEEMALSIRGKKNKLTRQDLIDYFGRECLQLTNEVCLEVLEKFKNSQIEWRAMIERSFLPEIEKENYLAILSNRMKRLEVA